jgi:hypothetical protein
LFDGSPLLRHTPMNVDPRCEPPWSDRLPSKVDDFICLMSINPKDDETPRACHVRHFIREVDNMGKLALIFSSSVSLHQLGILDQWSR